MNKEKIKEFYKKFREAWKDPRKKAGIKLLGYLIFFIVLLLIAGISNNMKRYNINNNTTKTTTLVSDKYIDKQNTLISGKHNINYVIKIGEVQYKINGQLNNNVVEGYLELVDGIKKIIIKDNIYEIVNNEEIVLNSDIDIKYLSLSYIFDLVKKNSPLIEEKENNKTYTYNIDNVNIVVNSGEKSISEIKISSNEFSYLLNFDK